MPGILEILGMGSPGKGLVAAFVASGMGATALLADTSNWVARVVANGGSVTAAQISAVDTLARRIVSSGLRSAVTRMNPMVGNAATIVVPYWNDWGATLDTLAGAPTIDANGMTVTGNTQSLSTGITPSAQAGWDSTNAHLGVHVVYGNPLGLDYSLAGCWSGGGAQRYGFRFQNSSSSLALFPGNGAEAITVSGKPLGFLSGHRMIGAIGGAFNYYEEGVSKGSGANTNVKPTTVLTIGNATGSALNGDFIIGGYHLGGAITAANALVLGEAWHQFTQTINRQRSLLASGDSLTANLTWPTLYQTNFSPKSQVTRSATGGIGSATCLANLIADIAVTPAIRWYNFHLWIGQNDGGTNYGATTITNTLAILAQILHTKVRITAMVYKNVAAEWNGQTVRAQKDTVTTYFATNYPTKAINYTTTLQAQGGTGAAGTVAQDARDVANGIEPSSFHLDLAAPAAISAITNATNAKITATAHGCINGDTVYVSGSVVGMTQIQGIYDTVTVIDANNFTLDHTDSTGFTPYVSGGAVSIKDLVHFNPAADVFIASALNTSTSTWTW